MIANGNFRFVRAVASAELPIVLAISPALLFPSPRRLLVLLVVPIVWGCARISTGSFVPRSPVNAALWLLLAMAGISLYATFDVGYSLGKVSGLLLGVLLFWAITRWATTTGRLQLALASFVLAGAGLAILGVLGTNWFDKFPILGGVIARLPRAIRGVSGAEQGFHPNEVAGCLVLFVPLQVALLMSDAGRSLVGRCIPNSRLRWLVAIEVLLLILTAGTLVLTQSRGAWVGLTVAVVAFLAWHGKRTRVLAAIAVVAIVVLTVALGPERVLNLAISRSGPGMAGNVSGRMELWSRAIYGIQDFPLTGMGMNAFRKVMPVLYPAFQTSPDFDVAHAHNHLLQAALDLGIPGLIAYSAIWMVVGALLVMTYRRSGDRVWRVIAGGLGAGLIAHFTFSTTDTVALGAKAGIVFWLTLALAVALYRVALCNLSPQRSQTAPRPFNTAVTVRQMMTISSQSDRWST